MAKSKWAKGIIRAARAKKKTKRKFKWTPARRRAFAKMRAAAKGKARRPSRRAHKPVKTTGRQRLFAGACGCNRRCCSAAGSKCSCRCHGRNHGGVQSNPPRATSSPKLHVHRFRGVPTALYYRRDGKTYAHTIGAGARILIPKTGDFIIIKGVRTGEYLEG